VNGSGRARSTGVAGSDSRAVEHEVLTVFEKLEALPARARAISATGEAGNGSVTATITGSLLTRVEISEVALRHNTVQRLEGLLLAAILDAEESGAAARRALLAELTLFGEPLVQTGR
jgi:DNA-binding protein YbaB